MSKSINIPPNAQGVLYVCCTSHMDWDWIGSFEDYYSCGLYDTSGQGNTHNAVRYTLDQAFALLEANPDFQFNLAEVAWLQRWLQDNPDKLAVLVRDPARFMFLGGGTTSPDNLICHGEVFIRNYLTGRSYLKKIGLSAGVRNVCWIPDDFGQDPELPVVLNAMGMKAAAFWRVPGFLPGSVNPVNGGDSMFTDLLNSGVCFSWQASDGAVSTALLLSDGYGVPFYISETDQSDTADDLNGFVNGENSTTNPNTNAPTTVVWPNSNMFVPAGGDFSTPSSDPATTPASSNLWAGIDQYNIEYFPQNLIYAVPGTFDDYLNTLSGPPGTPQTLNPSNYWTGFFASRPQLKIYHNRAARYLLAAETALSMLAVFVKYSSSSLAGIQHMIQAAWEALAPSSHHDFVTGTAPDNTYWSEQLPLLETAVGAAENALNTCLQHLAKAVQVSGNKDLHPVLVYNDLGFQRTIGTLVELEGNPNDFAHFNSVQIGSDYYPVQYDAATGKLLFQCPALPALSYQTVCLSTQSPTVSIEQGYMMLGQYNSVEINNGRLTMILAENADWGITTLVDNQNPGVNIFQGIGNQIAIYDDQGNLYQFGNELYSKGFEPGIRYNFVSEGLAFIENGPLRWRFAGYLKDNTHNLSFTVEYILVLNEPVVRMRITGQAPATSSVVTRFPVVDGAGNPPLSSGGLSYGTANHWHVEDTVPYWSGPTFLPTHDFVLLNGQNGNMGGIYHQGTPAWTLYENVLMGVLLRNADGNQRGAAGTDDAVHTQAYAFRLPGVGQPASCEPLQEAYSVQQGPFAQKINIHQPSNVLSTQDNNQLAYLSESTGLIRMVRTQPGSGSAPTVTSPVDPDTKPLPSPPPAPPLSLVFRIYQPTNDLTQTYQLNLPFASANQPLQAAAYLTALEETPESTDTDVTITAETAVTIAPTPTLSTIRIQTLRPYLEPNDGR